MMNTEEDKIFSCVRLLYYVNNFFPIREWRTVRRYRRMDINGFNLVLEKFSFGLKVDKQLDPMVA